MEGEEEGEQSAEPEDGPDVDAPLTEEAAYPTKVGTVSRGLSPACPIRQHATTLQHVNEHRAPYKHQRSRHWFLSSCMMGFGSADSVLSCPPRICLVQRVRDSPLQHGMTGVMDVQAAKQASAKRSAGDAAAQDAVDDMLAEQEGEGDADEAPEEAAEEAEDEDEDLDDATS